MYFDYLKTIHVDLYMNILVSATYPTPSINFVRGFVVSLPKFSLNFTFT